MDKKHKRCLRRAFAAAIAWSTLGVPASGQESLAANCMPVSSVDASTSRSKEAPLEFMRRACPLLGDIVEKFAARDLGESFSTDPAQTAAAEIAAVAAFAAAGDSVSTQRSARYALAAGASQFEFEQVLYFTAVEAGVPKAIEATRALAHVLAEQPGDRCVITQGAARIHRAENPNG
jgi:alkylhydroperoxidase/carboxymuconolactone decarboxylase family protein YurZ